MMLALLENDWFDALGSFAIFGLPSILGFAIIIRDARRAVRNGRVELGSKSGEDTEYDKELDPRGFWAALAFKSAIASLFFCFPLAIFLAFSWPHWRSIASAWRH
jgi:hypothetical protein